MPSLTSTNNPVERAIEAPRGTTVTQPKLTASERVRIWESKNKQRKLEWRRRYRQSPKGRAEMRRWTQKARLKKFNITPEQYENMLKSQDEKCYICERHQTSFRTALAVDHCHKTGQIRGLLCSNCNRSLGMFGDSIETLNRAIEYLKRA